MSIVYEVAGEVARMFRGVLNLCELRSFGSLGLVMAARRFDPSRGRPFEHYARPRITGAMISGVRRESIVRRRQRRLKRAAALGGVDMLERESDPPSGPVSSGVPSRPSLTGHALGALADALLSGGSSGRPDHALERCETYTYAHAVLWSLTDALPDDDKAFLELVFGGEHAYAEVAEVLCCSVSSVKRRLKRMLDRLEAQLRARGIDGFPSR